MYIAVRSQAAQASGELKFETKPTSTDGCSYSFETKAFNSSVTATEEDDSFHFHHISYMYFSFIGTLITIIISFAVSLITSDMDTTTVDSRLLAPFMSKYYGKIHSEVDEEITMEAAEHMLGVKEKN